MGYANIQPGDGRDDFLNLEDPDVLESLNSGILQYEYKNGRCNNIQPDGIEDEYPYADVGQHVFGLLYNGELSLSPTSSLNRVLDVGAGSGKWAMDMGVMYPDATITGIDVADIQPSWTPENVSFDLADANESWSYDEQFDLIHVQQMAGSIKDWAYLCGQAMNNLTPGGYLEIHEFTLATTSDDRTLRGDASINRFNLDVSHAYAMMLGDGQPCATMQEKLERAGFVDIQKKEFYVPTNTWPADEDESELGKYRNMHYNGIIQGSLFVYLNILARRQEDAQGFLDSVRADVNNRRVHAYDIVNVFIAKKPDNY